MKKLKIKSLFDLIILIVFTISIITVITTLNITPKSSYKKGYNKITGTITECTTKKDQTTIVLKAKENILIHYYNDHKCKLGKQIKVEGNLEKTKSNTIFNLFNYQNYLYSKKIYYQMTVKKINETNNSIKKRYKIKNSIKNYLDKYKSKEYLNVFILGNTKEIDKEVFNSYKQNGISHLLANSGRA